MDTQCLPNEQGLHRAMLERYSARDFNRHTLPLSHALLPISTSPHAPERLREAKQAKLRRD